MLTLRGSMSNVNVVVGKTVVQSAGLMWRTAASLVVTVLEDAQRNQRHAVHRTARAAQAGLDVRGRQPIRADGGTTATT